MKSNRFQLAFSPYKLIFKEPAGTSRGVLKEKRTVFVRLKDSEDPSITGYGEVPVFEGLSRESYDQVIDRLKTLSSGFISISEIIEGEVSSIKFGLESAMQDIKNGSKSIYFPSCFTARESSLTINGLIWMGDFREMERRLIQKIKEGFRCIKIKIGAIKWREEIDLIKRIRSLCGDEVQIRVDANGAFSPYDCLRKLDQLAVLGVHSVEQPIKARQLNYMRRICCLSPVPIALDEELIGIAVKDKRSELLEYVKPAYIILKPSLCFGFSGTLDWIKRATALKIGWWITSALESNVGLDAIAQFTGRLSPVIPQGLGTGTLYNNNLPSPLLLKKDRLSFSGKHGIYRKILETLDWCQVHKSPFNNNQ